ncbi:hypothetical protein CFC21_054064 [Triticum aestivum]|uniref:DUF3615 domain-containing protein n=2 Tax=Triticum aestivum TaxID=4565 RepID=A0A3B6I1W7_WHEAT|nr:uncharacterized protein LOC119289387 isoform X1 [Triticum dicoccoides]XP_044360840.1 uncharacterized protein LOC123082606 isoform X1 [Triticum aestivum]KAF7044898.1 hypothetical protein CFC21_054064 [Triticum aestivum]
MSVDDCFIPLPSPLHDRWRCGSHPCLSQLDLDDRAAAGSGTAGEGDASHGVPRRILRSPNRPLAVPPTRLPPPPLDPLPTYKGNSLHAFPEDEPKQHQVAVSRAASKGRYARFKENLNAKPQETKQHHDQVAVSCAPSKGRNRDGWMSQERSTPEGINMEEHALRFRPLPRPKMRGFDRASIGIPPVMQKRKPPEVRNALRERRVAAKQKDARHHAEVALRKYNRANNINFELVEVKVISIFYEFGGAGAHYNFTAKQPEDQQNADADSTKLFFSEVDLYFRSESDVIMCCIVGENDAGRCYGCENYQPVVHPSSQAYGGGSSTCIEHPGSDGDSDSD